jgi:hypothetical protein
MIKFPIEKEKYFCFSIRISIVYTKVDLMQQEEKQDHQI